MNVLANLDTTYELAEAPGHIIAEVQARLCMIGLLDGAIDGKAGKQTLAAFAKFKRLEYLDFPSLLGKTTALTLLEASTTHPTPSDTISPQPAPHKAYFPKIGWVAANDRVYHGGNFTWGEFTKNLARVPQNSKIVENLMQLAEYLEKVRQVFDERSISINSGYRPPDVNKAVKGASNSQHLYGTAVDIVVNGVPPTQVFAKLNAWHGSRGGLGKGATFTHLDLRGYRSRFSYG